MQSWYRNYVHIDCKNLARWFHNFICLQTSTFFFFFVNQCKIPAANLVLWPKLIWSNVNKFSVLHNRLLMFVLLASHLMSSPAIVSLILVKSLFQSVFLRFRLKHLIEHVIYFIKHLIFCQGNDTWVIITLNNPWFRYELQL